MNLITLKEAADLLHISPRAALNMCKRGALVVRAQTVNGLRANLVSEDDVRALAREHESVNAVDEDALLRLSDAARMLGVSRQAVDKKVEAAKIPVIKKNDRAIYITLADFQKIAQPVRKGRKPNKPAGF